MLIIILPSVLVVVFAAATKEGILCLILYLNYTTELYCARKDTSHLIGITTEFAL